MSEADRLFEELGYKKETREDFIEYINKHNGKEISFGKTTENVCASQGYNVETITMQELKAINKKCLELRMDRGVINNGRLGNNFIYNSHIFCIYGWGRSNIFQERQNLNIR